MKRLHVHMAVPDLEKAVQFYSTLFGAVPTKLKPDYAKWMLEDPRVNFAISLGSKKQGVDHLGIQVEQDTELVEVRQRLEKADLRTFAEGETTCCYAKSDKSWILDPAGTAWETYKTMEDAEVFHGATSPETVGLGCCAPAPVAKKSGCCG